MLHICLVLPPREEECLFPNRAGASSVAGTDSGGNSRRLVQQPPAWHTGSSRGPAAPRAVLIGHGRSVMRRLKARAAVVVAAGAVAGTLGVAGVSAAGVAARAPQPARTSALAAARGLAVPGARLWVRRFSGPGNGSDVANSVAVSPGGGTVFVTGGRTGAASESYLTVAYNAASGARLWTARYNGPGN